MAIPSREQFEKVIDLYDGIALYKVHVDCLREQNKNARVMSPDIFSRLEANISKDNRLESMPYCHIKEAKEGNLEFHMISGHHRIRAARKAGITEMFIMSETKELPIDQVRSKQLAHNKINGIDDDQILKELWDEIDSVDAKISSGIKDEDFNEIESDISFDEVKIDLDYEIVSLLFLDKDFKKYGDVLSLIEKNANIQVADKDIFEDFKKTVREVYKQENVRNITAALIKMCRIVTQHYVIKDAMAKKKAEEDLKNSNIQTDKPQDT